MRLIYAVVIGVAFSIVLIAGCEPEPEIFAMKKERLNATTSKTTYYTNGMLRSESISTRDNGIDDVWRYYENGVLTRIDEDLNFDGVVDKIRIYDSESGKLRVTKIDANFDGTFEIIDEYEDVYDQSDEKIERQKENQPVVIEEKTVTVTDTQPEKSTVYQDASGNTRVEQINIEDEMVDVPPAPASEQRSTIIIEEDEMPRSKPGSGSYFEPLEVNPGTGSVTPARDSKIVPAPVFTHPSDNLGD